jgi:hypothetical protein
MKLTAFLCGALVLLSGGVQAQAASSEAPKQPRADCAKAKDRKACEARRKLCAQSGDPAKCEANAKRRQAHRKK